MDNARNAYAKTLSWPDPADTSSSPALDDIAVPSPATKPKISTDEEALDRWFREQKGNKRVPRRLDVSNEMLVTNGGPLNITGNITLINEDGSITHSNDLSLCRCGASKSKPYCGDEHLDIEFFDNGAITNISDWAPVKRPQTVTLTCVKDGPLKFNGYLRIYNKKGQEFISKSGALCRCGKSSNKPFCDSKNGCMG